MQKENLSLAQLLALIFIFLLGSAIIMGVATELRQNAWIGISIATVLGTGLMYFYYTLIKLVPNHNLYELMEYGFTRPIAIFFSAGYIIYFFYISSRLNRDFAELITTAVLPLTPIEVTILTVMLVIVYILYLGIEVLARVSEIFFPYLIGFLFLLIIFLFVSGRIRFQNALPILGDGFMPVIKGLFPGLLTFPFGELIVFTVILTSVTNFEKAKKVTLLGTILAGFFLAFATFIMLIALGADTMQFSQFPLLSAARKISVANFIERTDAFVVFIMLLGILVKSSIFLYAGLKGLEYIFKIPYRNFTFPIGMLISCYSVWIASNFAEHVEEGLVFVTRYFHPPMQFGIPGILLGIILWKNKKKQGAKENSTAG
ncbi:GerAB/ArcD/ProY family transporter [Niallia endozanthoxylica]|uniref:GerAB/ArcD/ProY family transporter n=1 Tax=Niallia endozanthoxylica TaxID=2036016 RepID=A0A5J5I9B7_9BACI|nr:GerAB/ArcD/ProY family transporter [Niallia endozanthoxylica]KAA9031216.1 GerAB/ArcD/ProY family transporter [Niallia endozanthoxylica]